MYKEYHSGMFKLVMDVRKNRIRSVSKTFIGVLNRNRILSIGTRNDKMPEIGIRSETFCSYIRKVSGNRNRIERVSRKIPRESLQVIKIGSGRMDLVHNLHVKFYYISIFNI